MLAGQDEVMVYYLVRFENEGTVNECSILGTCSSKHTQACKGDGNEGSN